MSTSPEEDPRSFSKQNLFNFKASAIKPTGTLYSDANSSPNNKSNNNAKQGFSFLKLDSSLTASEIFPTVGDNVTTDPNLSVKEVLNTDPAKQTESKAPVENNSTEEPQKDSKLYVFGQKIEARVVIHELDASEPSSQDTKLSNVEGVISTDNTKPLLGSLPVQKVFTGEEGERVIVEISCKLYVFDSSNKTWHSKGRNMLHLNQDSEEDHKSRIICRAHGNQLVLLNSPIWAGMLCELSNPNSVKLQATLQEEGIRVVLIQGEKRDIATFYDSIKTRINNCTLYKAATTTPTRSQEAEIVPDIIDTPDLQTGTPPSEEATDTLPQTKRPLSQRRSSDELDCEDKSPPPDHPSRDPGEDGTENSSKRSKISDSVNQ